MLLIRTLGIVLLAAVTLVSAGSAGEMGLRVKRLVVEDTSAARVIVKYRANSALRLAQSGVAPLPQHAALMGQRLGLALADRWVLGEHVQSLSAQGISSQELASRLAAQPDVEWAEPVLRKVAHAVLPNDPLYPNNLSGVTPVAGQWYLRANDNTFVSATNAVGAWGTTTGSASITVAVLDTGVLFNHPDFKKSDGTSKLYAGYDFISRTSASADGDGRDPDATDPGDWTTASDSCGASDSSWHGTQTASLIGAATDNGVGMASVARDVMVLPVRVLGKCGGYDDDIQAAMLWAAGLSTSPVVNLHPARVVNMSLGATGSCSASYQAVVNQLVAANVVLVVSAGNDEGVAVSSPANCSGAVAVAGLRNVGTKVGYSSLGPEVAISAPAGNCVNLNGLCLYPVVTATNAGKTTAAGYTYSDSSNYSVGTSFSAPLVAGTAALMLSVNSSLTAARVKSLLQGSARSFPTSGGTAGISQCHAPNSVAQDECYCTAATCGAGMLDTAAAVAAAANEPVLAPAVTISVSNSSPTVGDSVALTGTATPGGSRSIAGYAWAITSGGTLASFSGSTSASTATLVAAAAGSVTVTLTVVDSAGVSASNSATLNLQAPVTGNSGGGASSSSSGGGGAVSFGWLLGLCMAVLALTRQPVTHRRASRRGRTRLRWRVGARP